MFYNDLDTFVLFQIEKVHSAVCMGQIKIGSYSKLTHGKI